MSYILNPLFTFMGNVSANATTGTNNDIADVFDVDRVLIKNSIGILRGGTVQSPANAPNPFIYNGPQSNPALREWLMGYMNIDPSMEHGMAQQAHWNYYGDHDTSFVDTFINNYTEKERQPGSDDILQLAKVELLGDLFYNKRRGAVIVDVDPFALVTSQIFAGQLRISATIDGKQITLLEANFPSRAYSYYINPHKILDPSCIGFEAVSAIFQCSFDKSNIRFTPEGLQRSLVLNQLQHQMSLYSGLQMRYCFYDAVFEIDAQQMHDNFMQGNYVSNPYKGRLLGTIGLWKFGELASAPPGRKLTVQQKYSYTPPAPSGQPATHAIRQQKGASLAKYRATVTDDTKTATVGPAILEVDAINSRIVLDLISTFPEANIKTREKFDLGTLILQMVPQGATTPIVIGTITNTQEDYEANGGLLEFDYSGINTQIAPFLDTGTFQIILKEQNLVLLSERPGGMDVQTDNRAVYFNQQVMQNGQLVPGTANIDIQVRIYGNPPQSDTLLNLEMWTCSKTLINPDKAQEAVSSPYFKIDGATPQPPQEYPNYNGPDGSKTSPPTWQVTVPAGGNLTLQLTALQPGVSELRFVDPNNIITPNFAWDNVDYAVIRILPTDDYSQYSDQQINNWSFIYQEVFSVFSLMYPIMSTVIPWGPDSAPNDPVQVKAFASTMVTFTDPKLWDSTVYMPITRDLSAGKRELLRRWCNLQLMS